MAGEAHFEIFPDLAGDHRFRLRGRNGEIVHASQGYRDDSDAERGVADFLDVVLDAGQVDVDSLGSNPRIERVKP